MKQLSPDWFYEGAIDLELKQYELLAYLQSVRKEFDQTRLYPAFSDLITHFRTLKHFNERKAFMNALFPKELEGVDWEKFRLKYHNMETDSEAMEELQEIISYAIPQMKPFLEEGKAIYELVENSLEIGPIGVEPIYKEEGYWLVFATGLREVKVYRYKMGLIERHRETFRSLYADFLTTFSYGIANTLNHIKTKLVRIFPDLPNPATYSVEFSRLFPEEATSLPVLKRQFLQYRFAE